MVYRGNDPFVFVIYSHADKENVENLLRFLYRAGIRFCYDGDIRTGDHWSEFIYQRWITAKDSSFFSLMASNNNQK